MRITTITKYICSDGFEFDSMEAAEKHELHTEKHERLKKLFVRPLTPESVAIHHFNEIATIVCGPLVSSVVSCQVADLLPTISGDDRQKVVLYVVSNFVLRKQA